MLEPFDGVIVGGSFPPADDNGGTLSVHVVHPSLARHSSALLDTAHGEITLVDSSHEGVSSSQETVGGHGDALLRTFTVSALPAP